MLDIRLQSACCPINHDEFALFRNFLSENSGILVPAEKAYLFETRLSRIMAEAGFGTFGDFYRHICDGQAPKLTQKIIEAMVTNETMWFRDGYPFKALSETILPPLTDALRSGEKRRVRVWCAAVSTGQEAYSAAMCIDDYLKRNAPEIGLSRFDIWATDISGGVLEIAKNGCYDSISMMRGLDERFRRTYFAEDDGAWSIDPAIRSAVRFERFNLQNSFSALGIFDIIFCRYVLIYFAPEFKRRLVERLSASLYQGGVLFAESYTSHELFESHYDIMHLNNSMYYTKKAAK